MLAVLWGGSHFAKWQRFSKWNPAPVSGSCQQNCGLNGIWFCSNSAHLLPRSAACKILSAAAAFGSVLSGPTAINRKETDDVCYHVHMTVCGYVVRPISTSASRSDALLYLVVILRPLLYVCKFFCILCLLRIFFSACFKPHHRKLYAPKLLVVLPGVRCWLTLLDWLVSQSIDRSINMQIYKAPLQQSSQFFRGVCYD